VSGKVILRALFVENEALTPAPVPAANIVAGRLSVKSPAPSIGMQTMSLVYDRPLRRGPRRNATERVRVVVYANDETSRDRLILLVTRAGADQIRASFPGVELLAEVTTISVRDAGRGSDFAAPNGLHGGSFEFLVSYSEPA
jgi:hypothetical protein